MLTSKVYASQVNNLSDARYFAAWGVHYLGFDIDGELTHDQIKEIVDWVEGPLFVAESNAIELSDTQMSLLAALPFSRLQVNSFYKGPSLPGIDLIHRIEEGANIDHHKEIILSSNSSSLQENIVSYPKHVDIWLETDLPASDLKSIMEKHENIGIIVRGGEEERPGIRNFEEIDDFFDILSS